MKKATCIVIGVCLLCSVTTAQDLNGFWKGSFNMQGCFLNNNIELQITMKGESATGDSYHYQDISNYVKKKFTGVYDPIEKKLLLREGLVTIYHLPRHCVICVKQFDLVYSREGNREILRGQWGGNVLNSYTDCGIGSIVLTRIKESAFKEIPEIKVDTGTIRLDFYDNAEIDGDSITVKVDNRIVFSHQRLSANPLTSYIKIDLDNTFHEVEMIAENLGTIPPNTAILVVTAGETRHRLALNSTGTKSARVRFVYEAKEDPAVKSKYSVR